VKFAFLDTVGLLALWNRSDQWHEVAARAYAQLIFDKAKLYTSSFVLLECANAATRRPYRADVARLRAEMERAGLLVHPTGEDWSEAWNAYSSGSADRAGVVDHTSFLVMRRMEIQHAFTNDRHFKAAGFEILF
jgi:uncharacterized protein